MWARGNSRLMSILTDNLDVPIAVSQWVRTSHAESFANELSYIMKDSAENFPY